jgi:hypothetical protein
MAHGEGIRQVAWLDCAGGGQVVLDGNRAYIGHMDAPHGTSVVDVSDPANPRITASIDIPAGLHSHKVRVANDIMLVNRERTRGDLPNADFVGLRVFDVSKPDSPRDIHHWKCSGTGVHRFTFDGRYAYVSAEQEGYVGTIVMILDFANPEKPEEVGRWWMPGQWTAGGETPTWKGRGHRCHHPIRRGDRLYVSYWYGGGVILDISDMRSRRRYQRSTGVRRSAGPHTAWCRSMCRSRGISGCWWRMSMCSRSIQLCRPSCRRWCGWSTSRMKRIPSRSARSSCRNWSA